MSKAIWQMARYALAQYNEELAAGGEPTFPQWACELQDTLNDCMSLSAAAMRVVDAWRSMGGVDDRISDMHSVVTRIIAGEPVPLQMVLYCPSCGMQHIDAPEGDWTNPPHRSHLCHGCGHIWRPADVYTEGVAAILTRGKADTLQPLSAKAIADIKAMITPPKSAFVKLPRRRFEHVDGFQYGAQYVEFPEGSDNGQACYDRAEAEAFVKDGTWREVTL